MTSQLYICGIDKGYMDSLVRFLLKTKYMTDVVEISVMNKGGEINVTDFEGKFFLVEESYFKRLKRKHLFPKDAIIILCERLSERSLYDYDTLFKYQEAGKIAQAVYDKIIKSIYGSSHYKLTSTKLLLFTSTVGMGGCSLVSEIFSAWKAKRKKTLHICFDTFHKPRFRTRSRFNASDFFVYTKEGGDVLLVLNKMIESQRNLDVLYPFLNHVDEGQISTQELVETIKKIVIKSDYEYVNVDFGTRKPDALPMLTELAHRVIVIDNNDIHVTKKTKRYEKELAKILTGEEINKYIFVTNEIVDGNKEDSSNNAKIHFEKNMEDVEVITEEVMNSSFGKKVKEILKDEEDGIQTTPGKN